MLNTDVAKRDKLIFGKFEPRKYCGGIRQFEGMSLETLDTLLANNFADKEERQNESPTIAEFRNFMQKHPGYTAHGYTVELAREDYRVTVEGLEKSEGYESAQELEDFIEAFRYADDFTASKEHMFCWFD